MPAIVLHTDLFQDLHNLSAADSESGSIYSESGSAKSPLPKLLSTPSGLAIIEIQGTIHAPFPELSETESSPDSIQTPVGRLEFPLYDHNLPEDTKWMKKVYLYVGQHQRLVGEVKKLAKPLAIVQKRGGTTDDETDKARSKYDGGDVKKEALEIAEIVEWKIIFQGRPEPV